MPRFLKERIKRIVRSFRKPPSIDALMLVAGPSGAGKSTLISKILESEILQRELLLSQPVDMQINTRLIHRLPRKSIGHLILHYDTLRPIRRHLDSYADDKDLMDVVFAATHVAIVDVVPTQTELLDNLAARSARRQEEVDPFVADLYAEKNFLHDHFEQWRRFCRHAIRPHHHFTALRDATSPAGTRITIISRNND